MMENIPRDFVDYVLSHTSDFTGRKWVFSEIDNWIADLKAPRYFILTGEPGIGKTAIAARLAQLRDLSVVHFCIPHQAETVDPVGFVRSFSHQLTNRVEGFVQCLVESGNIYLKANQVIKGEISGESAIVANVIINTLIVNAPSAKTAFAQAVLEPLKTLYANGFAQQLVVLVDALDEAMQIGGGETDTIVDLLASTQGLPKQVRFILTSRSDLHALCHFECLPVYYLEMDVRGKENLQDTKDYVYIQVEKCDDIKLKLLENNIKEDEFVNKAVSAGDGNFLYVSWLLDRIADGTQSVNDLTHLPKGIDSAYREFLRTRRVKKVDCRPLLGILAVAQTPLTSDQLEHFTGLGAQKVNDLLFDLRQFIVSIGDVQERRYRLYHHSVASFLGDRACAREFWIDLKVMHQKITAHYQKLYTAHWCDCDSYGLYYLPTHLYLGEQYDALDELARDPRWYKAKFSVDYSGMAFNKDIDLAIQAALAQGEKGILRVITSCLLKAGIGERAEKLSPDVIETMAYLGHEDQALSYATFVSDPKLKAQMLCSITSVLHARNSNKVKEALYETLAAIEMTRGQKEENYLPGWMKEIESEETIPGILMQVINMLGELKDAAGLERVLALMEKSVFEGANYAPRTRLLIAIAYNLTKAGDLDAALGIAERISTFIKSQCPQLVDEFVGIPEKTQFLIAIVGELLEIDEKEIAQQIFSNKILPVFGGTDLAFIVSGIARIAAWNHDFDKARQLIDLILLLTPREQALAWLAEEIAFSGVLDSREQALEIASELTISEFKAQALLAVVFACTSLEQLNDLIQVGDQLDDRDREKSRSKFLCVLSAKIAEKGDMERAAEIVAQIKAPYWKIFALAELSTVACQGGHTDQSRNFLEQGTSLLEQEICDWRDWGVDVLWQQRILYCLIGSKWAQIDCDRGRAVFYNAEFHNLGKNLEESETYTHATMELPFLQISKTCADLGDFAKAEHWINRSSSTLERAEAFFYLSKCLAERGCTDQAVTWALRSAELSIYEIKNGSWPPLFSSYDFTELSRVDKAIINYGNVVRLAFQIGGNTLFASCLEMIDETQNSLVDLGHCLRLLACLESIVSKLGWEQQVSILTAKIDEVIGRIVPFYDPASIEEIQRNSFPGYMVDFWVAALDALPERWIVHRYAGFEDIKILGILDLLKDRISDWFLDVGFVVEKMSKFLSYDINEGIENAKTNVSIHQRNKIICSLADHLARFKQYDAALQVTGLARIHEFDFERGHYIDPVTLSQIALLSCRIGNSTLCHDVLTYVVEYLPDIPDMQLFGGMSESFVYATKAASLLGDEELVGKFSNFLRSFLQEDRSDLMLFAASEHYAGILQYIAPALANIGDIEGLRLSLKFAQKFFWGDDQATSATIIAKAMAMVGEREDLELIFDMIRSFNPERIGGTTYWISIVRALLDAQFEIGDYEKIIEIAKWLLEAKPGEDFVFLAPSFSSSAEVSAKPCIASLLAYASRLLSKDALGGHEWLFERTRKVIVEAQDVMNEEEAEIGLEEESLEFIISAYLDLSRSYMNIGKQAQAEDMLYHARTFSQKRYKGRFLRESDLDRLVLFDLSKCLVACDYTEDTISFLYRTSDEKILFELINNLFDSGNYEKTNELLDGYSSESDWWQIYWHVRREIDEVSSKGILTAKSAATFWEECMSIEAPYLRGRLCLAASTVSMMRGNKAISEKLIEYLLNSVEYSGSVNYPELTIFRSLIDLATKLGNVEIFHRMIGLVIADDFSPLAKATMDRETGFELSVPFVEKLLKAMATLKDVEGLCCILKAAENIKYQEFQDYRPHLNYPRQIDPLLFTQVCSMAQLMESHSVGAVEFRNKVISLLAKAFGELGLVDDLHQLLKVAVSPLTSDGWIQFSDGFLVELGAYGTIGKELFQLEGEKGISDILDATKEMPEVFKPLLLANSALATRVNGVNVSICHKFIDKAILAMDLAKELLDGDESIRPEDKFRFISNNAAVVGATASLVNFPFDQCEYLFDKAISAAKEIPGYKLREETLSFVVHAMSFCAFFSGAFSLANTIIDKGRRESVLGDIAEAQARRGQILDAIETMALCTSPAGTKNSLIFKISPYISKNELLSSADKLESVFRVFLNFSVHDVDSFWRCLRAMLPVMQEIGGGTLLLDVWRQVCQLKDFTKEESVI